MEILIIIIVIVVIIIAVSLKTKPQNSSTPTEHKYLYARKDDFITPSELEFFRTLVRISEGKYYVFPQVHLSALFTNKTVGRYYRAAFSIINGRSVDYVLCKIDTLVPVYAVELDDWTHGSQKRQKRDREVEAMFQDSGITLVRFRNYKELTDDDIIQRFSDTKVITDNIQ